MKLNMTNDGSKQMEKSEQQIKEEKLFGKVCGIMDALKEVEKKMEVNQDFI